MTQEEIQSAVQWFSDNAEKIAFGELSLTAVIHQGKIKYLQRKIEEKVKLAD